MGLYQSGTTCEVPAVAPPNLGAWAGLKHINNVVLYHLHLYQQRIIMSNFMNQAQDGTLHVVPPNELV